MPHPAAQTQPSPQLFFDSINAYQRSAALKAALELDVFTAIGEGEHTTEAIALRTQSSVRGIRILADALTVIGFLNKRGDRYELTPDSATFLDRRSPQYIGGAAEFLGSAHVVDRFRDLAGAVRRGGAASADEFEPDHPMWSNFARSMSNMMTLPAHLLARLVHAEAGHRWKVLDIAAGHGMYGITVARQNPNADVYALDWAGVLQAARENAEKVGVADRWHTLPGSAFEVEFGNGYDLALITNFLHHFDVATCEGLLKKVHRALAPNGCAVIVEFVPNDDRITPPQAAMFPLIMLTGTPQGDAYTFGALEKMCRNAGFGKVEMQDMPPTFFRAVVAHK
jgi:ubiquinone/menaquinone biosynthesis C-methylase UbiE